MANSNTYLTYVPSKGKSHGHAVRSKNLITTLKKNESAFSICHLN